MINFTETEPTPAHLARLQSRQDRSANAAKYASYEIQLDGYHAAIRERLDRIKACRHVWPDDDMPQVCDICGGVRVTR